MAGASREFQVFVKPVGSRCNLACRYCYYLGKEGLYPAGEPPRMPDDVLEEYIVQHIAASVGPVVRFSWHGGEPTLLGVGFFQKVVALQRRHQPAGRRIENGIQTNGTLLDGEWCRFLARERFAVGLSLDGPQPMHDRHRVTKSRQPTYEQTMRGYELLRRHGVDCDVLCVVNAHNARDPGGLYRFFKHIGARYLTFLPLVEPQPDAKSGAGELSVPPAAWGDFLCTVFDEWMNRDIGRTDVQTFDEAARMALTGESALCIFKETCGHVPVVEHNGDFYSCDHFVAPEHRIGNIRERSLAELLESPAQRAFGRRKLDGLPAYCRTCEVLDMCHGECPKNRFLRTPDGEPGLNYLCEGYKRFFSFCRPFLTALTALGHASPASRQAPPARHVPDSRPVKTRRNDPCPCGSGKKYKVCCMGR